MLYSASEPVTLKIPSFNPKDTRTFASTRPSPCATFKIFSSRVALVVFGLSLGTFKFPFSRVVLAYVIFGSPSAASRLEKMWNDKGYKKGVCLIFSGRSYGVWSIRRHMRFEMRTRITHFPLLSVFIDHGG